MHIARGGGCTGGEGGCTCILCIPPGYATGYRYFVVKKETLDALKDTKRSPLNYLHTVPVPMYQVRYVVFCRIGTHIVRSKEPRYDICKFTKGSLSDRYIGYFQEILFFYLKILIPR